MKKKKIVITGGTAGLGKELALEAARRGNHVAVISRSADDLTKAFHDLGIIGIKADLSKKESITRVAAEIQTRLGPVDVLFNNASRLGDTPLRLLADSACESLVETLELNLLAPFRLTKALLGAMVIRGTGTIVNISSDAAVSAYPEWGGYSVSKAALDHLTRIWNVELEATGVQFLAVDPGDMHTAMHLAAIPDANVSELYEPADVAPKLLDFIEEPKKTVRFSASEWRATL